MTAKNTLSNKYMAGETSAEEERQLKSLLLNTPHGELTSEETAILQILTYEPAESKEEDIFCVDYTKEFDKAVRPRFRLKLWHCIAAACVAGILFICLMPPKKAPDKGDDEFIAEIKTDSIASNPTPQKQPEHFDSPETSKFTPVSSRRNANMLIAKVETTDSSNEKTESIETDDTLPGPHIPSEADAELAQAAPSEPSQESQAVIITATHPERLEYTPEDIEALKAKAKEKYLEWLQLEQEIINADMRRYAEAK